MNWQIPLTDVTLGEEEAEAAAEVVRSGWLTQGERVAAFEREFAAMVGVAHAVAVNNCTVGLELAYAAAGVGPGDEVVVPALTFVATANAARRLGATPVFADVASPDDLCVSPADVAAKVTPRTRAVVAVHYAGFAADVAGLRAALDARGATHVPVVEDCAHAPGALARDGGARCGALGRVAAFSFFSNKNMTTGEGGMVTTGDADVAAALRLLRSHGMTTVTWDRHRGHAFTYDVARVGTNARLDEVRAAIGRVQLRKLAAANARRAEAVAWYREAAAARGLEVPFTKGAYGDGAHHLFVVLLPEGTDRPKLMAAMREAGVQTSVHYPPTHRFTAYADVPVTLPVTDAVAPRLLTLPLGPATTRAHVEHVMASLDGALAAAR
ncbi:MAG: DegT/DnrJ/EryC1/StrS family aminotransferase [Polyangiales bacterium]